MSTPSSDPVRAANRRGVLATVAGMASFVANDALVKYVSQQLPPSQLIFVRSLFATALLFTVAHALGQTRQLAALLDRRVMLRAGFDAFATFMYLLSLFHLPIANATAINMATPLVITLFAVLIFREQVGLGRWLAIAAGFTGVLLIVQPAGAAFNAYALLCFAGTLMHASRDLTTRFIAPGIPSVLITLSTALTVTLLAGLWGLVQPWQPASWQQLGLLAAAGVFLSGGYFLITVSMRAGEMSVIAPFRYTALLFAVILGYFVWGDVPDLLSWSGIALLVAAGLYVLHSGRARPLRG